jgi:hypothetical protein
VDSIGGLQAALELASTRAGIPPDRPVRIVEWPRLGWFSLDGLPGLIQMAVSPRGQAVSPAWLSWLQFRLQHNGEALLLLPEPLLDQFGTERDGRR